MDYFATYPLRWLAGLDVSNLLFLAILPGPNRRFNFGYTPLHAAALDPEDNTRLAQLLIEEGADVNSATQSGYTPLQFAACTRKRELVNVLIEAGAFVNSEDEMGRTALHYAVSQIWSIPDLAIPCDIWIVERLLLEPDIHVNAVDHRGQTPLMWAVKGQFWEAVEILLKKGANPNIPCNSRRTPLHEVLSLENPRYEAVICLLLNGAGIYCADNWGWTSVDYLVRNVKSYRYVYRCVELIAILYHIEKGLEKKLAANSILSDHFDKCRKEVSLMKRLIVYDNVTLHEFALDCFQERDVEDPAREIYTPVVEILSSGMITIYSELISSRLSVSDLLEMLNRYDENSPFLDFLPSEMTSSEVCGIIKRVYEENVELNSRLNRLKSGLFDLLPERQHTARHCKNCIIL